MPIDINFLPATLVIININNNISMKTKKTLVVLALIVSLFWQTGNSIPQAEASNWFVDPVGAIPSGNLAVKEGDSFSVSGWFSPHYVDITQFHPLSNPQDRTRVKITTTGCVQTNNQNAAVREKERIYQDHWFSNTSYIAVDQWSSAVRAISSGTGTITQELSINNNAQHQYWSVVPLGNKGTINVTCNPKKEMAIKGSVAGHVLNNSNKAPLDGWKVVLQKSDGTSLVATSDTKGHYAFPNLELGLYLIHEEVQPNWSKVSPDNLSWKNVLISNSTPVTKDFLNQPDPTPPPVAIKQGSIQGKIVTPENKPLVGWSLQLISSTGSTILAKSDNQGKYIFNNVTSGTYTLKQVVPSGWVQTSPTKTSVSLKVESNKALTQDFINQAPTIGGCKKLRGCN